MEFIALMEIMAYIPLTYVVVAHTLIGKEINGETDAQHTRFLQDVSHGRSLFGPPYGNPLRHGWPMPQVREAHKVASA
jgi:hypothetical protein